MKINATYRPFGIGFDQLFQEFDLRNKENSTVYPPHNVVKLSEEKYIVELAVAGFKASEIEIETIENSLVVTGEKLERDDREYSHKGISTRKFTRSFTIAEHVVVNEASLSDGIISILLERLVPEEKKPRKIVIKNK
jgi:molecular chaperone IbpA